MKSPSGVANKWQKSYSSQIHLYYLALVLLISLLAGGVSGVSGQYGAGGEKYGGQMSATGYEHTSQGYNLHQGPSYESAGNSYGDESRSKVQLGIRLRIPAMKFELPRFNMPKITISAKIRQPEKPRTIQLPEINLDTSSRVAPPGASQPNEYGKSYNSPTGGYGSSSSYGYGPGGQTSHLSFTTGGDEQGNEYGGNQPVDYHTSKLNQSVRPKNRPAYGASNLHSTYYRVSQQTAAPNYEAESSNTSKYNEQQAIKQEPQVIQYHHQQQINEPIMQQQQVHLMDSLVEQQNQGVEIENQQLKQQQTMLMADPSNEFIPEKHLADMGFNQPVQMEPASSKRIPETITYRPFLANWRHRAERFAFPG